jgi:16S rRNA A1518/A1519 N6-dimethyltransferase RsmA/KsgA/DIM1 with predicted DNA glycosylase/AP lyase activity
MLQKEVAERLAAGPGSKTYGILSVFLQAYYDIEYLFTVHEDVAPGSFSLLLLSSYRVIMLESINC